LVVEAVLAALARKKVTPRVEKARHYLARVGLWGFEGLTATPAHDAHE
jgi:hypothetical protein